MIERDETRFGPDLSKSGVKSEKSEDAVLTWFGPVDDVHTRFEYPVIKEEEGIVSIAPGEGRFKKGLKALRYTSEDTEESTIWLVLKTRPNRIDLRQVEG